MLDRLLAWKWLIPCLLLAACSGYAPPDAVIGMSRDEVLLRMGKPDLEFQSKEGVRLEFPRGPFGRHTWFVYLDGNGKVTRSEQVLTEQNFNLVNPDMTQAQVRQLLGRPSEVKMLGRERGVVWNYRYENNSCLWFQVEMSLQEQVRSAGYGEPPECQMADSRS